MKNNNTQIAKRYAEQKESEAFDTEVLRTKFTNLNESFSEISDQNKDFLDNLHYAQIIQDATLPKQRHFDRIFTDSFSIYNPKSIIGGDFYWCSENDKYSFIAVGDSTGHGVPGAMLATLGTSLLNYAVLNKGLTKSDEILKEVDKRFIESFMTEGEYLNNNDWIEMAIIVYDKVKKVIQYSGAKTPIFIAGGQTIKEYKGDKYPIGGWQLEKFRNFTTTTIPVRNEDWVYISTDGYFDQFGGVNNKRYTKYKLKYSLLSQFHKSGVKQKQLLHSIFNQWKSGYEQTDDVCLVGVKF
jgi:serine phosphatase RsbU (regulator of sigma subunit)